MTRVKSKDTTRTTSNAGRLGCECSYKNARLSRGCINGKIIKKIVRKRIPFGPFLTTANSHTTENVGKTKLVLVTYLSMGSKMLF